MPARFWTAIGSRRSGHSSGLCSSHRRIRSTGSFQRRLATLGYCLIQKRVPPRLRDVTERLSMHLAPAVWCNSPRHRFDHGGVRVLGESPGDTREEGNLTILRTADPHDRIRRVPLLSGLLCLAHHSTPFLIAAAALWARYQCPASAMSSSA